MRAFFRHAGALSVLIASGLAPAPVAAHAALVRGLATAAQSRALDIPGFGVAFANESSGSYRYACDAQLGATPFAEQRHLVSVQDRGWLLVDSGGLHRISPSGCAAPSPEGLPSGRAVAAVAVAPGGGLTAYVVDDQAQIYRSDDAGATWRVLAGLSSGLPVTGLALAGEGQRLYVSQSSADEASLAWSIDAGATFETTPLPSGAGLVTLEAVESGEVDRLWLSASQASTRDVAIWRMAAGGEPETVHRVRFFGGLALGDDAVWVGDEAGGLYRSEDDGPFTLLQPDLAVSCLHRDGAGALWVCTPATSDQNAVLFSDDLGDTLQPQLALQQVETLVECPEAESPCASAWNEWQADVLHRATDPIPGSYPGTAPSLAPTASTDPVPSAMREASAEAVRPELRESDGCSLAPGRRGSLAGQAVSLMMVMLMVVRVRRRNGER